MVCNVQAVVIVVPVTIWANTTS